MEEENYVAIWFGKFTSLDELQQYLRVKYDEDGDEVPSGFMEQHGIEDFEPAFQEAKTYNSKSSTLESIFSDLSYSGSFIGQVPEIELTQFNAIICYYKYRWNGEANNSQLHFIGNFRYVGS